MIRPAINTDAEHIIALVRRAYAPYIARIGIEPAPMRENYVARIAAGDVWVRESNKGTVEGVIALKGTSDALLLENVAVTPESQGLGVGRALIAFAEAEATKRGFRELHLYTNAQMSENIRLYESLGFIISGRKFESGFDRIYLKKELL